MKDDYDDKRRRILEYVLKHSSNDVTRRVPLDNDDVPEFIRKMREFERDSKRRKFLAWCYSF